MSNEKEPESAPTVNEGQDTQDVPVVLTKEELKQFYEENEENIQSLLACPITCFFPPDPVVADDGNIYDDDAIGTWHSTNYGKSPLTNQAITNQFQPIPLWSEITKAFIGVDSDLQDMVSEKDYTYEGNRDMLFAALNSQAQHHKLLKYKGYKLADVSGMHTFVGKLFQKCFDLNVIKHVLGNCQENIDGDELLGNYGMTLIHYACKYSTPEIIKYLITEGHDIMKQVEGTSLPSIMLLQNKNANEDEELMESITDKFKDTSLTIMGTPLLSYAVKKLPLPIIKMLVDAGHDITTKVGDHNLLRVAYVNRRDTSVIFYLMQELMKNNKEILDEAITEDGCSIVHVLLGGNSRYAPTLGTVKRLIELGINMEVENPITKWRPIHYVCFRGKYDVIEYIMGIGINLTVMCYYEGVEIPPLALLDVNGGLREGEKQLLIEQFFQFIELQKLQ